VPCPAALGEKLGQYEWARLIHVISCCETTRPVHRYISEVRYCTHVSNERVMSRDALVSPHIRDRLLQAKVQELSSSALHHRHPARIQHMLRVKESDRKGPSLDFTRTRGRTLHIAPSHSCICSSQPAVTTEASAWQTWTLNLQILMRPRP